MYKWLYHSVEKWSNSKNFLVSDKDNGFSRNIKLIISILLFDSERMTFKVI